MIIFTFRKLIANRTLINMNEDIQKQKNAELNNFLQNRKIIDNSLFMFTDAFYYEIQYLVFQSKNFLPRNENERIKTWLGVI